MEESERGVIGLVAARRATLTSVVITFADCVIDLDRVEIRRAGQPVVVRPQVFDVIEYLVRHRDRVVGRDELLDEVWQSRHVGESTVASCIKACRKALGDDGVAQQVIRTVTGRGYRFVADAEVGGVATETPVGARAEPAPAEHAPTSVDTHRLPLAAPEHAWPFVGRVVELERISAWYHAGELGGVRLRGAEGTGVTALGIESARRLARRGVETLWVTGSTATQEIGFAAVRGLVGDIPTPDDRDTATEFTRSSMFRAALSAARTAIPERSVLVVDEPDRLDNYSAALLGHVIVERWAFVIVLERTAPSARGRFDDLAPHLADLRVGPLVEADIDVVLYRVLAGPVDPVARARLIEVSGGRPRMMRDVIETSLGAGRLARLDGAWTFVGEPVSSRSGAPPDGLSIGARDALERVALATTLPLETLVAMVGDAAVDELDERRLLTITDDLVEPMLSMADPLLAVSVVAQIGPLQTRRLRAELADHLLSGDSSPRALASVVAWAGDVGADIDVARLLEAAQVAMIGADLATAGTLVDHVAEHDDPNLQLIDAEVSLQRNRWERAERCFAMIDTTRLDDASRAHVLRRRASIDFYRYHRHDDTIQRLADLADEHGGRVARALHARRLGMLAYVGRAADVLEAANEIEVPRGMSAIEIVMARGSAHLHRGDFERALVLMDDVDERIATLPEVFVAEPRDGATAIRCSALVQLGRVREAAELLRRALPIGGRTTLGYLPSLGARVERACGRPRAAREVLRQAIGTSHRDEFPQYLVVAEASAALAELDLGNLDAVRAGAQRTLDGLAAMSGELAWQAATALHEMLRRAPIDGDVPSLATMTAQARSFGAHAREAELSFAAIVLDPDGADVDLDRLWTIGADLPGTLWPIRLRHAAAALDGGVPVAVLDEYRALGIDGRLF